MADDMMWRNGMSEDKITVCYPQRCNRRSTCQWYRNYRQTVAAWADMRFLQHKDGRRCKDYQEVEK